jgi:hypothetical protein
MNVEPSYGSLIIDHHVITVRRSVFVVINTPTECTRTARLTMLYFSSQGGRKMIFIPGLELQDDSTAFTDQCVKSLDLGDRYEPIVVTQLNTVGSMSLSPHTYLFS